MNNLKQLRTIKKVNQEEVSAAIGVTRQAYSHYERGEREPDHEMLIKLAKYFDTSIDYILGNGDYLPKKTILKEQGQSLSLNQKLKNLRHDAGKLQKEVAKDIKISVQVYCNYENGQRSPSPEMLSKLADYFNVSVDYLLGRDTPENANNKTDEKIARIDLKFNKLNKEQQEQIENYVDFLLSQKK